MFREGDWLRMTAPHTIKEGQVVEAAGPSLVVRWLGGVEQVFPTYEGYVPPMGGNEWRMELIPQPKDAGRIRRDERKGVMSIARAAATLGVSRKRVRAMLRAGSLRGIQREGRWVSVNEEDVERRRRGSGQA